MVSLSSGTWLQSTHLYNNSSTKGSRFHAHANLQAPSPTTSVTRRSQEALVDATCQLPDFSTTVMDPSQDVFMGNNGEGPNPEPFTVEENIKQLNEIDKCIVQLMSHTATALNALTLPPSPTGNPPTENTAPPLDAPAQKEVFRTSTDSFLTTLHTIDVKIKRQVMALEEAGIVNLTNQQRQDPNGPTKPSLKPSGAGAIGNLDVGWLNSRGTRVERDMEAELWGKAKDLLEKQGPSMRMDG